MPSDMRGKDTRTTPGVTTSSSPSLSPLANGSDWDWLSLMLWTPCGLWASKKVSDVTYTPSLSLRAGCPLKCFQYCCQIQLQHTFMTKSFGTEFKLKPFLLAQMLLYHNLHPFASTRIFPFLHAMYKCNYNCHSKFSFAFGLETKEGEYTSCTQLQQRSIVYIHL